MPLYCPRWSSCAEDQGETWLTEKRIEKRLNRWSNIMSGNCVFFLRWAHWLSSILCDMCTVIISTNPFFFLFFFFWMSTNLFVWLFGNPRRWFLRSFWLFLSITFLLFTPPLVSRSYAILWFSPFSLLWSTKFNVCSLLTNQTKSI